MTRRRPFALIPILLLGVLIPFARPAAAYPSTNMFPVQLTGPMGVVPSTAIAVALNVTATNTEGNGYVTVWPCSQGKPNVSSVNFVAGRDASNAVIIGVGAGSACVQASANANVIVDITGYFTSGFTPLASTRVLDTRSQGGPVGAGQTVRVNAGVPAGSSAALNVTAVSTEGYGYLTVYPCDQPRPQTSNVNYDGGDVPGMVISRTASDGTVCIYSYGKAHVLVDVTGYFTSSGYSPLPNPARSWDTRGNTPFQASSTLQPVGGGTVVLNVTATNARAPGYFTAYTCGQGIPNTSSVNFAPSHDVSNLVIGTNVCLHTSATTDLIVDTFGTFPSGSFVVASARLLDTRSIPAPAPPPSPAPPTPPTPTPPTPAPPVGRIAPNPDGSCPDIAPIKGNANSGIYHRPGQKFYNATKAEDCFATAAAAEAAGYRAAKV